MRRVATGTTASLALLLAPEPAAAQLRPAPNAGATPMAPSGPPASRAPVMSTGSRRDGGARRAARQGYVRGIVVEDGSTQPLMLVEVFVALPDGTRWVTRSDAEGAFLLVVPAGRHEVRARRVGFAEARVAVDVPPGADSVRRVELYLEPLAAELAAVEVTARGALRASAMQRVAERRFLGLGEFVEREEIARRGEPPVVELLRAMPGVRVTGGGPQAAVTMARARPGCLPVIFLDGTRLSRAFDAAETQQSILAMVPGRTIETIEVYRGPSETPAEFGGAASPCGVIGLWSTQPTRTP